MSCVYTLRHILIKEILVNSHSQTNQSQCTALNYTEREPDRRQMEYPKSEQASRKVTNGRTETKDITVVDVIYS